MDGTENLKLRLIDAQPLVYEGESYLMLRDPLLLSEKSLLVPQPLIPLLGLVPVGVPFSGLEISRRLDPIEAQRQYRQIAGYPLLKGGDAHRLEELHGFNRLCVEEPSLSEIALALRAEGGRSLEIGNLGSDNPRAFR